MCAEGPALVAFGPSGRMRLVALSLLESAHAAQQAGHQHQAPAGRTTTQRAGWFIEHRFAPRRLGISAAPAVSNGLDRTSTNPELGRDSALRKAIFDQESADFLHERRLEHGPVLPQTALHQRQI